MTIKVGHKGSNRRTPMASKETSTRGTGKGGKLPSGTEDQLIKTFSASTNCSPTRSRIGTFTGRTAGTPMQRGRNTSRVLRFLLRRRVSYLRFVKRATS